MKRIKRTAKNISPFKFSPQTKLLVSMTILLFLGWFYLSGLKQQSFHVDEHEFVRKSYYYDLFFLKNDLKDARWYTEDAPFQPKFGPYIYGLTLHLSGIHDIEEKMNQIDFGNIYKKDISAQWTWWRNPPTSPSQAVKERYQLVWISRKTGILFSLATFIVLLTFLKQKSFSLAILSTSLLGTNSLMQAFGKRAMTDSMQLFAFFSNLLIIWMFLKSQQNNQIRRRNMLSLAMGLNLAFAVGVKVSGIIILPFIGIIFLLLYLNSQNRKTTGSAVVSSLGIITSVFLIVFVLFHPYLYEDTPYRFVNMFIDRMDQAELHRLDTPFFAVNTRWQAFKLIVQRSFSAPGTANFRFFGMEFDLLFFISGVWLMIQEAYEKLKKQKVMTIEFLLLTWTAVSAASLVFYLKNDFPRYYLPTIANLTIIEAYALHRLLKITLDRIRKS